VTNNGTLCLTSAAFAAFADGEMQKLFGDNLLARGRKLPMRQESVKVVSNSMSNETEEAGVYRPPATGAVRHVTWSGLGGLQQVPHPAGKPLDFLERVDDLRG
jgi:hypothetical protein